MTLEQVTHEALGLSEDARARLTRTLLESMDSSHGETGVEEAWDAEVATDIRDEVRALRPVLLAGRGLLRDHDRTPEPSECDDVGIRFFELGFRIEQPRELPLDDLSLLQQVARPDKDASVAADPLREVGRPDLIDFLTYERRREQSLFGDQPVHASHKPGKYVDREVAGLPVHQRA